MLTFYYLCLQKLAGFKPSCLSTRNENTTPMADITWQSVVKPPNECHACTHQIKWKKQSREHEKLRYKFSTGKQASVRNPGCFFLLGACCQHCLKATTVPVLHNMPGKGLISPSSGEHAKSQYLEISGSELSWTPPSFCFTFPWGKSSQQEWTGTKPPSTG